jgi:pilus assembly protein Flp/PilA
LSQIGDERNVKPALRFAGFALRFFQTGLLGSPSVSREGCHRGHGSQQLRTEFAMKALLTRFAKDNSGATAIEYGLIAAGIAAVIILAVNALGTSVNAAFGTVNSNMK